MQSAIVLRFLCFASFLFAPHAATRVNKNTQDEVCHRIRYLYVFTPHSPHSPPHSPPHTLCALASVLTAVVSRRLSQSGPWGTRGESGTVSAQVESCHAS